MRLKSRLARVLFWGMVLVCSVLAGGAWFAFAHFTDGETAKSVIRFHSKKYLPGSDLEIDKVDMQLSRGDVTLKGITLRQNIDGVPFPTIGIPRLQVKLNFRKVIHGEFDSAVSEVIVGRPTMQIRRRKDGTWNLQGLLADPWPGPAIKDPPPVVIKDGTVELLVEDDPASAADSKPILTAPRQNPQELEPHRQNEDLLIGQAEVKKVTILRDVNLTVRSAGSGSPNLEFDGTAKGDGFDQLQLKGMIDPATGRLTVDGDLSRLTISEMLMERIPREFRDTCSTFGLRGGEVNLWDGHVSLDPWAPAGKQLDYRLNVRLSAGDWQCRNLPFPISDLSARLNIKNGDLSIENAEGHNGQTTIRIVHGKMKLGDPATMPFDFLIEFLDLMLDDRLKAQTPPEHLELWDVFKPSGKVNAAIRVVRASEKGLVGVGATVICRGVSGIYRHFPYPIENMDGKLTMENGRIEIVELKSMIAGKPIVLKGTIDNPGPDAIVKLGIEAESVPVDQKLLDAMPPDVRKVVDEFEPSGTASASVKILRKPTVGPRVRPEGDFELDAVIDLKEQCSIRWKGLPYPVRNLTGRLNIHPDLWQFEEMRGVNGQSVIKASGEVRKLPLPRLKNGDEPLKVDVTLNAENLLFNDELRDSLQLAWRKTWNTINPTGATDVTARVAMEAGKPDQVDITLHPRPQASIRLVVPTLDPNFTPVLPMENVTGDFVFHNSVVTMSDAKFQFRGAPVSFDRGIVKVEDNGKFDLAVNNLRVSQIRVDSGFRKIMPQKMSDIAARIDDGKAFSATGDLQIGWSGVPKQPAWCKWMNTKAYFVDNSIKAGIPLEHIQGELKEVQGWSDGKEIQVSGKLDLDSVNILGQQLTGLKSRFNVDTKFARMEEIQGILLGGRLSGNCWISTDSPTAARYFTHLKLENAGLEQYGLAVPGRQTYKGLLNAELELSGLGPNIRSLRGNGWANVSQGDLGELPLVFRFAKFLNENIITGRVRSNPKTAFEEAGVRLQIHDGVTTLNPITFTGSAIRLEGEGTLDPQGNLNIGLAVLGRGAIRLPLISEGFNMVSKEMVGVLIEGPVANPNFKVSPLPALLQNRGRNRGSANTERGESARTLVR